MPNYFRNVGLLIVFLVVIALSACGKGGPNSDPKADAQSASVPVEVATAVRKPINASYSGTTTLTADREAQVVSKTSGVLIKLMVEEGMHVTAGQVLVQLDDESLRLSVAKAEATMRKLDNDFRRSREMFDKKLVSIEQHDKIRFELDTQRAAYDLAKLELSYARIVAPIAGVVSQRMVKEGNLIQEHQTLFKIDNFDPLLAVLNVPERELNTLKVGQTVGMAVDALPGQNFDGKIARISPVVDAASGTFRVTCEFRDKTNRLKSGMFGRLEIIYDHREDALTVPRSALIEEDGETAVFVVEEPSEADKQKVAAAEAKKNPGGKPKEKPEKPKDPDKTADAAAVTPALPALVAHRRVLKIGYVDSDKVEIRDGLSEGARVVTVGRNAVRDGTPVQVLENKL